MKRILYCASTAGHLRSFHLPYLTALVQAGHRVTAAAAGTAEGLPAGVSFVDVPFTKSFTSVKNLRAVLRLARLLGRERFDLVLTHTSLAAFFTRLALRLAGKKHTRVVNTVHGYLFGEAAAAPREKILLAAEKLAAPVTDDVLVMNGEDARIAAAHRLYRDRLVSIDGMGIDGGFFRPPTAAERADARRALGLGDGEFALLYAAEFSFRKNQRFLIESLPALPESVILLFPGRGELWAECRALADSLGVSDRVRFPGFVTDVRSWIWAADACASASRSEGLPFHVMEAMSCGLPSVLSDVKGNADLMAGGAPAGLLYVPGDSDSFRAAAETLLRDPERRTALGENARRAAARYDIGVVLPQVLPYYQ